jgi:hypothetical protein
MVKYQWVICHFPLAIPRGPHTELVSKYKELRPDITPPPVRERPPTNGYQIRLGRQ